MAKGLAAVLRWLLLLIAVVLATAGLFTAVMAPVWIDWRVRLLITGVEGELGYRYLAIPLCVALAAVLSRRKHPRVTAATVAFCAFAVVLMSRPVLQAWSLGKTLPMQLEAAFGKANPPQPPFSFGALFADLPDPVPVVGMKYIGPLRLEFYRAIGRASAPCVISLHGGGFTTGGHDARRPIHNWLARNGYAVATPDYQGFSQARWPAQRYDVRCTIAYLRANAAALGIDPNKIILMGFSAGGVISEATAYAAHDRGIRGVISFAGYTDPRGLWYADGKDVLFGMSERASLKKALGGTPEAFPEAYDSMSGLALAGPTSPPTLLIHGHLDSLVPERQSELLAAKLAASGVPHALVSIPWGTHGSEPLNFQGPGMQISTYAVAWFLQAVTKE